MDEHLQIMIVDDEQIVRESFRTWFGKFGHRVDAAASGAEALQKLEGTPFDLLFVDIKMPGMNGIELLEKVKAGYPDTSVVIITAYGSIETAVTAMKLGASDYLLKPFKPDHLNLVLEKIRQQRRLVSECSYLKDRLDQFTRFDNIIGRSPPMQKIFDMIPEVAASDASVLLTGETGTGKELVAKAIHAKSARAERPFIAINCGAVPDSLIESELFGHRKGAFTGAVQNRRGFLEVVTGGTLFLDEIGEISQKMQIDLLRVLEEKRVVRVGDSQPIDVDFRLISATRKDLRQEIAEKRFRQDFFYRINVVHIPLPPLRERQGDIPLLIEHFLKKYSRETAKQVDRVSADALSLLQAYEWPGNVRELENVIERAVALSRSRTLGAASFSFLDADTPAATGNRTLRQVEAAHIANVLAETDGNVTRAAEVLGINRVTLHKKIKRYGLKPGATGSA